MRFYSVRLFLLFKIRVYARELGDMLLQQIVLACVFYF